jgi:hypothetical protein
VSQRTCQSATRNLELTDIHQCENILRCCAGLPYRISQRTSRCVYVTNNININNVKHNLIFISFFWATGFGLQDHHQAHWKHIRMVIRCVRYCICPSPPRIQPLIWPYRYSHGHITCDQKRRNYGHSWKISHL